MISMLFWVCLGWAQPLKVEPQLPKSAAQCQVAAEQFKKGEINSGIETLEAAAKAFPDTELPHEMLASVYSQISNQVSPNAAVWYRELAEDEAEAALKAPLAEHEDRVRVQVLLENIHDRDYPEVGSRNPEALKAFEEGEQRYSERDFKAARKAYGRALELDPSFAMAALYMGDCFHGELNPFESIAWFRKATEIQPRYPRAWRYLSDGYLEAKQSKEAEDALLGGLAAHPCNRVSWLNLAALRAQRGRPMVRLSFKWGIKPRWGKDGRFELGLDMGSGDPSSKVLWGILATQLFGESAGDKDNFQGMSRFQRDLQAWKLTLMAMGELKVKGDSIKDPILNQFDQFRKDGELESAVFLLRYREEYRPDFETWKKAKPNAIRVFLDRYNLRP